MRKGWLLVAACLWAAGGAMGVAAQGAGCDMRTSASAARIRRVRRAIAK